MASRSRAFAIGQQTFEVKARPVESGWAIQCFDHNQRVGLEYGVTWQVEADFATYLGADAVEELMRLAEASVRAILDRDRGEV